MLFEFHLHSRYGLNKFLIPAFEQTYHYRDLQWSTNIWSNLNSNSNWRFYLDTVNNFSSYQNTINVVYPYQSIGLYTISLTFASSGQVFQQTVNITDCKF